MKKLLVIYLILVHVFIAVVLIKTDIASRLGGRLGLEIQGPEQGQFYHAMLSYHKRMDADVPDGATIFVGDSHVQGLAVAAVVPLSVNYGIGRDTTAGVLGRLPFYTSLARARALVLSVGFNDLSRRSNRDIIENFERIAGILPPNLPVVVSAVLPIDERVYNKRKLNVRIRDLNEKLRGICRKNPKLYYMDVGPELTEGHGDLSARYHSGDGIHLNKSGSSIWITGIRKSLLAAISEVAGAGRGEKQRIIDKIY